MDAVVGHGLHWDSVRQEGVSYSIAMESEAGRRQTVARGITESAYTLDVSRLSMDGRCKVLVVTNDGVRSSEFEIASIDVPRRPPTAHILVPAADTRVRFGQPLSVLGCCLDASGRPCGTETWTWLLDGDRKAAGSIAAIEGIAPGRHELTLQHGSDAHLVETSVMFEVEEPDADYREWQDLIFRRSPSAAGVRTNLLMRPSGSSA